MKLMFKLFIFLVVSWSFSQGHYTLVKHVMSDSDLWNLINSVPYKISIEFVYDLVIWILWVIFVVPVAYLSFLPFTEKGPVKVTGRVQMVPRKESPQAVN